MAIAAPSSGVISEILVSKGDQVTSGQVIATLG
jgi:biotin carboxyl carrier protein